MLVMLGQMLGELSAGQRKQIIQMLVMLGQILVNFQDSGKKKYIDLVMLDQMLGDVSGQRINYIDVGQVSLDVR